MNGFRNFAFALLLLLAVTAELAAARELQQQQSQPQPQQRAAPAPAPAPPKFYIFGYGSLLSQESTTRTNCGLAGLREDNIAGIIKTLGYAGIKLDAALAKCRPQGQRVVRVKGLQRGWYAPVTTTNEAPANPFPGSAFNPGWTALGMVVKPGAAVTGLIYEVDREAYESTLTREKMGGYALQRLDPKDVTLLGGAPLPANASVTAFVSPVVSKGFGYASPERPIPYSYIDVWLGGALQLQDRFNLSGPAYRAGTGGKYGSFVEETVKTTDSWLPYITNDRSEPLRPYVTRGLARIDDALWAYVDHKVLAGVRYPGQPFPPAAR